MAGVGVAEVGQEGRGDGLLAGLRGQHGAGETGEKRSLDEAKAAKLTKVRMESARKMFDAVDIDRSGLLEPLEFKRFMRKLDATLSSTDIQLALGMLDKDGDGVVSFAEFSGWWGSGEPQDVLADLRRAIQGAAADAAPFSLSEDDAKESLSQDLQADPTGKEMMAELKKDLDDAPPQVQFPKSEQPQALTAEQQAAKNKELERLYLFQQFDTDGNGEIDVEELIELASALGETWSEEQALIAMDQMDGDGSGSLDLEELRLWYTDFERGGGGMLGEALRKEGDRRFRRFARALLEVRQDGEMSVEVDAALKAVQEASGNGFPPAEVESLISRCVEEDILMVVRGRFFFDDSVDTRTDIFVDDDESKPKGPSKPRHMDRPGWERAWSRSNMDWYWWNRETNESTWMDPIDFALAKEMPPAAAGKKGEGRK